MFAVLAGVCAAAAAAAGAPTSVLFVGNSFTYVNDLPRQFAHVAASLGRRVVVNSSTIGGCTLYRQQPSLDNTTAALLRARRWDYVVLQDYSALPTVPGAREAYLRPAVEAFARAARAQGAEVVMYLTWGYHSGSADACPTSDNEFCFPKGSLAALTDPPCGGSDAWRRTVGSFACMGYSLARGYLDALRYGADRVAPCGVVWQVVRGVKAIPDACRRWIDMQYDAPMPAALPYPTDAALSDVPLYRVLPNGDIDKHPNVAGQYLNALTMYAALFGASPAGAAGPLATEAGDVPLKPAQLAKMQAVVDAVVLQHRDVWRV